MGTMDNSLGNNVIVNRFDGLSEENKRLLRDLISFNKCLNVLNKFKAFIDLISDKIKTNLDSNELKAYEDLNREVEQVFRQESNLKEIRKNLWNSTNDPKNKFQLLSEVKKEITELSQLNSIENVVENSGVKDVVETVDPNYHPKGFLCDVGGCGKVLKTEDSLIVHKKGIHHLNQKLFFCDFEYCKYKTISEYHLKNHKKSHKNIHDFKCCYNVCELTFECEDSLNQHIREEHNITEFSLKCYYGCGKRFAIEDNLKAHVQTAHKTAYKPYKCNAMNCYKMFRFESKLKQHHRIVHERKWGCPHPDCDFFGRNAKQLDNHLESHSKFKCTVEGCDLAFVQKLHLKEHQSIAHPNEKLFFCQWEGCDKSFRTDSGFRLHFIKHTDTVFSCEWPGCGFTTKVKNCLKTHAITHSTETNFACVWPECGKRFKTKNRLECHLRIHNNDKRYACHWPGCQYRCTDSGNLSKHEKQVHKRKMRK